MSKPDRRGLSNDSFGECCSAATTERRPSAIGPELQRLLGATRAEGEIPVSTIHKVKGLEYDNVVVLPSRMSFGGRGAKIEANAAEEARLLYVVLTRAKSRLVFHLGDRELSWAGKTITPFTGAQDGGRILTGTPKEVSIS